MDSRLQIADRVEKMPIAKRFTALTTLQHFSVITYKVDYNKLRRMIPPRFDLYTIHVDGNKYGLISAVTFIDKNFHFPQFFPFAKFQFTQTNYRAYITNKTTGEQCAWFFGTGVSSYLYLVPRLIWKMPWFLTKYQCIFQTDRQGTYTSHKVVSKTKGFSLIIDITEDCTEQNSIEGFDTEIEAELILKYPVTGYYFRSDKKIGSYKIWHPRMTGKNAVCNTAYFEMFEDLRLLTRDEMQHPHSAFISNDVDFIIDLPPKVERAAIE